MHAVSACIYVVMPDAWCLRMHLCFHAWCMMSQHAFMLSYLIHVVSACIYFFLPDAWCLSMHLCCHAWCMICCSIFVIMPAWCMICRSIRIHLSRHVPALTFTILLQLEKNDYFSIGVILKSDLRIYDAQSQDGNLTHFNKNIYLIVTAIED